MVPARQSANTRMSARMAAMATDNSGSVFNKPWKAPNTSTPKKHPGNCQATVEIAEESSVPYLDPGRHRWPKPETWRLNEKDSNNNKRLDFQASNHQRTIVDWMTTRHADETLLILQSDRNAGVENRKMPSRGLFSQ